MPAPYNVIQFYVIFACYIVIYGARRYSFEDHDLLFSGKAYPGGVEDPFVYKDKQGNYHAVFHLLYNTRPADSVCGNGRFLGGHAFSPAGDGRTWTFTGVAYDGNVT